ncbi:MAG TPA: aminotransferase class IV [Solirubrobacterales bacterium]|nr:aminotransferase class IV [Solirubrobacterales bacterium]
MTLSHRQPDPSLGVFETLLVVNGEPVELERHLARLRRSLDALYGADLPTEVHEELLAAADGISLGRLRLTVVPGEDGLRHDLLASGVVPEAVFPERGAELRAHSVKGGHGSHKWVDRRGMEHPDAGPGQLLADGPELLEAGWANLFAVFGETLRTPAADGRILPGVARAAILDLAPQLGIETEEGPLTRADLLAAEEVFLTNSIRGVEAAVSLDDSPLAGTGPKSRRLAAALARSWRLPAHLHAHPAPATASPAGPPAR